MQSVIRPKTGVALVAILLSVVALALIAAVVTTIAVTRRGPRGQGAAHPAAVSSVRALAGATEPAVVPSDSPANSQGRTSTKEAIPWQPPLDCATRGILARGTNPDVGAPNQQYFGRAYGPGYRMYFSFPILWSYREWTGEHSAEGGQVYKLHYVDFGDPAILDTGGRLCPLVRMSYIADPSLEKMTVEEFSGLPPGDAAWQTTPPPWKNIVLQWADPALASAKVVYHRTGCLSAECVDVYIKRGAAIFDFAVPADAPPDLNTWSSDTSYGYVPLNVLQVMLQSFRIVTCPTEVSCAQAPS